MILPLRRAALASSNPHKVQELAALLPGWSIETIDMTDAPEETAPTFWENAVAKARFAGRSVDPGVWVLGEDSGLEVASLDGAPGVCSARYAGAEATDGANTRKLLDVMAGVHDRGARYRCELACIASGDRLFRGTGVLLGRLATIRRGEGGFGYDPIFVPTGETRTVAELGDVWKAAHSHRARAVDELLAALPDPGPG